MKLIRETWQTARKQYHCDNHCLMSCLETGEDCDEPLYEGCCERDPCTTPGGIIRPGERYYRAVLRPSVEDRLEYDIYTPVIEMKECIRCMPEKEM